MKALVTHCLNTGPCWRWAEVADPSPGPEDVVIEVRAAGLNHADALMRTGDYIPSDASWRVDRRRVGFECAGTVVATGAAVRSAAVGDSVMTQVGGACAELVAVDEGLLMPMRELPVERAAGLPSGLLTEYDALAQAGFQPGDDVLITGASSGVGRIGVQLAKALGARKVVATTRGQRSTAELCELGADLVIDTQEEMITHALARARMEGCRIALDHVGGDLLARVIQSAPPRARIIQIGRLAGERTIVDLSALAAHCLTLMGTTFRGRGLDELRALVDRVRRDTRLIGGWAAITPTIDRVYDSDQAEQAARRLRAAKGRGKIILRV